MKGLLVLLTAMFMMVQGMPKSMPELPCHPTDLTDPTKSRCTEDLPKPDHHVVKKSGRIGTRIGNPGGDVDYNVYWEI
ncbi:P12-like protein-c2 [Ichnoviriform fugitivi]|uniref:p12-like protein-c2 n=1 Tax=Ichnoviriform fugitivi TaxID=265522 RepID=Q6PYS8_9VIRU|nr:P12-like protein-c2 [Ichnoviriform fugitivi]AAS83461.1 P12-like protein-c2 [Ichnoviriform fugitivi]